MVDYVGSAEETVGQFSDPEGPHMSEFGFTILLLPVSMGHMWGLPLPAGAIIDDPMHLRPESALNHALLLQFADLTVLCHGIFI